MHNGLKIMMMLTVCFFLTACALFHTSKKEDHDAICKQLKHQIIWSGAGGSPPLWAGATGNQMQPTQNRAEFATLEKNYHDEGCE